MQTIRDNLATIVVGCVVAIALGVSLYLFGPFRTTSSTSLVALVHDGEDNTYELPLSRDDTLTVTTSYGRNVLVVADGSIRMEEADCPQGTCVRAGAIGRVGQQLICLPHRLWVEICDPAHPTDSVMDVNAMPKDDASGAGVDLVAR